MVVKKDGSGREVLLYFGLKTDTPGVLQRLELSERNCFVVST